MSASEHAEVCSVVSFCLISADLNFYICNPTPFTLYIVHSHLVCEMSFSVILT
jgi:hypothetical protein